MKVLNLIFILTILFSSLFFAFAQEVPVGCPGRTEATMGVDYTLTQIIDCVYIEINPHCFPNSPHYLLVSNEECDDILIYVAGDGNEYELLSKSDSRSRWTKPDGLPYSFEDADIPQTFYTEWTREMYFKNNPSEKIIISAKNFPIEEYRELIKEKQEYCHDTAGDYGTNPYFDCLRIHKVSELGKSSSEIFNSGYFYYILGGIVIIILIILIYFISITRNRKKV